MDVLGFATLVVGGFTACAEFGSYAFVHPVIRRAWRRADRVCTDAPVSGRSRAPVR